MKEYLIDVPVKINIWTRPECQQRQFDIIRQVRPSVIFLQSDGGRNEEEWRAIRINRALYDSGIDWKCKVYKLYESVNNGMYSMAEKTDRLIWSKVDRCIYLEDDYLPSLSFFPYCKELLDYYENDLRILGITGMNYLGTYNRPDADYFFSGEGCVWGTAIWKRTYEMYQKKAYKSSAYTIDAVVDVAKARKPGYERTILGYANDDYYEGHIPGSEFKRNLLRFSQNQLFVVPSKNMICNIGYGDNSAHSDELRKLPKSSQRMFDQETYELEFPIKHPEYVVCDLEYERRVNRILGSGHPIIRFKRKIERAARLIAFGDIRGLLRKINKNVFGSIEK